MSKSPAFQLYVNEFLGSAKVGMMSTDEIGAYLLLLLLDWQEDGFVYDAKRLAKWCRMKPGAFARAWEQVGECFVERDGRMWNPRLEAERTKQKAWSEKARKGATATNEKRNGARPSDRPSEQIATNEERIAFALSSSTPVTASSSSSGDVELLLNGLPTEAQRTAWAAEIAVAGQGMHGPPLTQAQIDVACRAYVGNGHLIGPNLRHFRAFLADAGRPPRPTLSTIVTVADDAEQAWESVLALVPAWQRREFSAEQHQRLPEGTKRGISKIGGFRVLSETRTEQLTWLKKDFLAAYRSTTRTPAHA